MAAMITLILLIATAGLCHGVDVDNLQPLSPEMADYINGLDTTWTVSSRLAVPSLRHPVPRMELGWRQL